MKYDLTKKPTRGAQRTLDAFSKTMFQLLSKKEFEQISVQEICEISNFPRATFYNYFDDKYDLLNYCWYLLSQEIQIDEHKTISSEQVLDVFVDRIYQLFMANEDLLIRILKHNPNKGSLVIHFSTHLRQVMQEVFYDCLDFDHQQVPLTLVADHFSNTVMLILEALFLKPRPITIEEAHEYLHYFVGHLFQPTKKV